MTEPTPIDENELLSETNDDASEAPAPNPASAAEEATGSSSSSGLKAVDTGRRVDPGRLAAGAGPPRRRRNAPSSAQDKPAPQALQGTAEETEATRQADVARGHDAARDDRRSEKERGRGAKRGPQTRGQQPRETRKDSPRLDDATIAARDRHTQFDKSGDFAAMLEEAGGFGRSQLQVGDKLDAVVTGIGKESVFFDLGVGRDGWMPIADLMESNGTLTVRPGDRVTAYVVSAGADVQLSKRIARGGVDLALLEEAKLNGIPVQGKVSGVNKGGLEVELGAGARGFCPIGQADLGFIEDPKSFEGKTLSFLVRDVREGGRNVVLSRKALLERERQENAQKLLQQLEVGQVRDGTVTRIQPFGAFVDLGGLDGLVPVSELSWGRVDDPAQILQVGQRVSVEVRKIEDDPKRPGQPRIGLSMRMTAEDPFEAHFHELLVGSSLEGTVRRVETFGAFVELFEGLEGLVHISELSHERVRQVSDVVQPGEPVTVRVLEVDKERRRISLTMREARSVERGASAPAAPLPARGKNVEGIVERIERYGVFVKLGEGQTALLPASETGTSRGTDLQRAFPIGTQLALTVIDVDDRGRVRVSKLAREQADERAELDAYTKAQPGSGAAGFGTFADLLKGKFGNLPK